MRSAGTPRLIAVASLNACANCIAAGLVAISSLVSQQSANASVLCSEPAKSGSTWIVRPLLTPDVGPAQPGTLSPSVEIPSSTIASGDTPRVAAVVARNASANAIAAGLVNISSGVSQQSSKAVGCSEAANSGVTMIVLPAPTAEPAQPG